MGREAYHISQLSVEFKNEWGYTSSNPPPPYASVAGKVTTLRFLNFNFKRIVCNKNKFYCYLKFMSLG
jgi:hypothetical protein